MTYRHFENTLMILAGAIAGYLVHLARKTRLSKQYALPTLLIAAAMTGWKLYSYVKACAFRPTAAPKPHC